MPQTYHDCRAEQEVDVHGLVFLQRKSWFASQMGTVDLFAGEGTETPAHMVGGNKISVDPGMAIQQWLYTVLFSNGLS